MGEKQSLKEPSERDYGYIEYFRKSMKNAYDPGLVYSQIKLHEAERDYYTESLWQINHLIQIDEKPNLELKEPRWEIYKISVSFEAPTGSPLAG